MFICLRRGVGSGLLLCVLSLLLAATATAQDASLDADSRVEAPAQERPERAPELDPATDPALEPAELEASAGQGAVPEGVEEIIVTAEEAGQNQPFFQLILGPQQLGFCSDAAVGNGHDAIALCSKSDHACFSSIEFDRTRSQDLISSAVNSGQHRPKRFPGSFHGKGLPTIDQTNSRRPFLLDIKREMFP